MPVTIPAVGTAEPLATVQIRAQVTGQLSGVHFTEGQEVKKGDTLFTLDAAAVPGGAAQAEAVLARDTAQSKNAKSQQARYEDLFDKRPHPARSVRDAGRHRGGARGDAGGRPVARSRTRRLNLQYTVIKAPISGRTGALAVHAGDLVRANDTTPLVVINQVAPIYVTFSVPGRYLPDIRQVPGARSRCRSRSRDSQGRCRRARQAAAAAAGSEHRAAAGGAAARPRRPAPRRPRREGGVVSFIDNAVDPTTGTIKLKGTFDNADHALWPGLFVQVTLRPERPTRRASSCRPPRCRRRSPASTSSSSNPIARSRCGRSRSPASKARRW